MADGFFRKTTGLGASYMLGAFNDNFFKQSALLLAVGLGFDSLQAYGTFLFALPFVLFSAWGGWLADRFPKKRAVIAAKTLELAAMLAGAWGILHLHWGAIMVMLFVMGGSSTLFSPALNGSIPELFPPKQVPKVNGIFKLCTTLAILLGVMLAGAALDCEGAAIARFFGPEIPFGRRLVALGVVTVAALGLCSTIFIPSRPAAATAKHPPFPWLGAWDSLKDYARMRGDRALFLTIAADAFFYGVSSLALLEINALGLAELGFSKTLTSLLPTALMAGICVGSLLAGLGTPESWRRLLPWAAAGIGLALIAAWFFANLHKTFGDATPALFATYGFAGLCGGLYIIPVSSFIQVRPGAGEKGRVLGTNNCLSFMAIMLAGPAYWVLHFVPASTGHLLIGLGTLLVAAVFALAIRRLPEGKPAPVRPAGPVYWTLLFVAAALGYLALTFIGALAFAAVFALAFRKRPEEDGPTDRRPSPVLRFLVTLFRALLALRYRVTVTGLDAIEDDGRPILFLPNHAALSDPMIVYSRLVRFAPRPLSDEAQVDRPIIRSIMRLVRPVTIPSLKDQGRGAAAGVKEGLTRCAAALEAGDNLLFYPAGGLTRDGREHLGANSGAHRLLEAAPECRVVLVRTRGLWGSSFSYALAKPDTLRGLATNALRLLANALFLMPRREVRITVEEVTDLPVAAGAKALNRYLEDWYEAEPETGALVPYYFWQGSTPQPLPAKETAASASPPEADIPEELRQKVYALLRETLEEDGGECPEFTPETRLAADMGIDSLGLTELSLALEELAGHPVTRLDALITVEDCVRAAAGLLGAEEEAPEAPEAWFAADEKNAPETRLDIPDANDLAQTILRQARRNPEALILAEAGAALTWQELWLRALALSLHLRRECPEARVGLMLPASTAACVGWLALLLAGKTPVMLNWTTGPANFGHCVRLSGIRRIVSARGLLDKLAAQGFDPQAAEDAGASWLLLEEEAAKISPLAKIYALVRCRLALRGLERAALPKQAAEHAAILFTSGSESAPKGVPLSHENILANCRDISRALVVTSHDRLLAMLPPFHSLGLTVNIALPLCFGIPTVLHPNPTEAARLARLCRRYRPTITAAPPTFLDGLLNQARPGDLDSLRLGVAGAEACPARVYEKFETLTGGALCEGYGVTECAPVVSVNRPEKPVAGSIGLPLPSVRVAIVTPEGEPRRVPRGEAGMLLVSGPNVFAGYLRGPEDMAAPADPFVDFEGKRWYRTGDLVRQDAEGRLFFAGRLGRFVKLGGEMISLPQMEQVLLDYVSRRPASDAAPLAGPPLAVEALERDGQPELVLVAAVPLSPAEANQALRAAGLSALYAVRRALRVEALPLLGSGKTDYRTLKRMIAS